MSKIPKALIIDDEADIRALMAMSLDRIGLDTHTAANLEEARHLLDTYEFDVCLTDMKLPDGDGVEFVNYLQRAHPRLPVAVVTAHGNMNAAVEAMKNGAFDFVSKPVDISLLRSLVTQAIRVFGESDIGQNTKEEKTDTERHAHRHAGIIDHKSESLQDAEANSVETPTAAHSALTRARESSDEEQTTLAALSGRQPAIPDASELIGKGRLIGRSHPIKTLRKMISKVARTNAPVWITGESGTGKELIARLVHENGPRADAPFVAINCGAIPTELMESEMFGHRKGSFTGAHDHHDGLFKRAEGGTLFLDEVAELPLHMQVKLLRAIQERTIRPVGSSEELSTNVRILSASHKDLNAEADEGRFRHDLYYRLNVICIQAPPLRMRSEDVAEIARHILKSIAELEDLDQPAILTPEAEDMLCTYSFPGNVRELENILERAVALSDASEITPDDLDLDRALLNSIDPAEQPALLDRGNHDDERSVILAMLAQTRWNRKVAAKQLGLTYRQLRYRIKQHGIDIDNADDSEHYRKTG